MRKYSTIPNAIAGNKLDIVIIISAKQVITNNPR